MIIIQYQRDYHSSMTDRLIYLFPNLRPKQINYLKNKISNFIRKDKTDKYEVRLSNKKENFTGYVTERRLFASGVVVYIYFTVD